MAKKKIKKYLIQNKTTNDFYKGRSEIKDYTVWTYDENNAVQFEEISEAEYVASRMNDFTEVVGVVFDV